VKRIGFIIYYSGAFWHDLSPAGEMCPAAAAAHIGLLANGWILYHILTLKSKEIEINVREMILVCFINPKSEYRNPKQISSSNIQCSKPVPPPKQRLGQMERRGVGSCADQGIRIPVGSAPGHQDTRHVKPSIGPMSSSMARRSSGQATGAARASATAPTSEPQRQQCHAPVAGTRYPDALISCLLMP
jgi:hypothetical protein